MLQGGDVGQGTLEKLCAEEFRVHETVLLPSARTGILLTLRATASSVETVVGPAFTCAVVHQAMQRSGLPVQLLDSMPCSYLMDVDDLRETTAERPSAIVLCETYGLRYCLRSAAFCGNRPPLTRIWDMAMCIPQSDDFCRLEDNDVAVVSFGLGKCLYAGWGGLLLTQKPELAARVRELRNALVAKETRSIRLRHGIEVLVRTTAHTRWLYGFGRALADWRGWRTWNAPVVKLSPASPCVPFEAELPGEWGEPMTPLNRKLAMANLAHAANSHELRRRQAAAYERCLESASLIRGFDVESLPESHYPIRVAARARNELRRYLASRGIDTATYFPFPGGLERANYPNAARASEEVILLPLGRCIREDEVPMVARQVREGLRQIIS